MVGHRVCACSHPRPPQGPPDPKSCGSDDPKLLNPCEAGEVGFGDVDLSLAGALSFVASDDAQPPRAARQARAITSLRFNSRVHFAKATDRLVPGVGVGEAIAEAEMLGQDRDARVTVRTSRRHQFIHPRVALSQRV